MREENLLQAAEDLRLKRRSTLEEGNSLKQKKKKNLFLDAQILWNTCSKTWFYKVLAQGADYKLTQQLLVVCFFFAVSWQNNKDFKEN